MLCCSSSARSLCCTIKEQSHSKIPNFGYPFGVYGIIFFCNSLKLHNTVDTYYAAGFHFSYNCERVIDNQTGCRENTSSMAAFFKCHVYVSCLAECTEQLVKAMQDTLLQDSLHIFTSFLWEKHGIQ